jgi:outer membrane protein assembly factor BamB
MRRLLVLFLISLLAWATTPSITLSDEWPQWLGPTRDGHWRETGIIEEFPSGGANILWRKPIHGGYAGPAVAAGRIYVMDFVLSEGDPTPNPDKRSEVKGQERVLCLDAKSGEPVWTYAYDCNYAISYPSGPRCTPTIAGGKIYALGAEGNLACLDANDGKVLWSKELKKEYKCESPIWGFTGHPLVDGDRLYCLVGGKGSIAVCFDRHTGKEIWRSIDDKDAGYCPPSFIEIDGVRQLVYWTPSAVHGLDPKDGKIAWSIPLEPGYGMSIAMPRQSGKYLFAAGTGMKSVLIELSDKGKKAKEVYRGEKTTSLFPVNSTPIVDGDYLYGVCTRGELRCVELKTGKRLWETFVPTTGETRPLNSGTAFLIKNGDRYFIFNEKGDLIIAKLSPAKYEEISRVNLLEPTSDAFGRKVVWSCPAFAQRCAFVRNDKEIVCVSLAK